jgi:hypothetical protein
MKVRQLTEEQKNQLIGKTYDGVSFFNPTQDVDGKWFISNEEVNGCTELTGIEFIQTLTEIDYNPIVLENPFN